MTQKTKLISEIPKVAPVNDPVETQETSLGELQLHIKKHQVQRAVRNPKVFLPSSTYDAVHT